MRTSILIADDELNSREGLRKGLETDSRKIDTAADGQEALDKLKERDYDILITDIRMPVMDGMTLLKNAKEHKPGLIVLVLTAYGTIEMAVESMKLGAYNYLTKPVNLDEMELLLDRVEEKLRIELEVEYHRESEKSSTEGFEGIIGQSHTILDLIEQTKQVASSKATVLINGETGTGKELVARALHHLSPRKDHLFVPIHCAALSENLLESELFGHERGAFTGAVKQRKGRFELADRGTLFLDEISEISPSIQVKLLRFLQEKEFERVGGTETISVDVRIVAATNMDLPQLVSEDKFREDLYYRLKVIVLNAPPLRERLDDIPLLVKAFVARFAKENGKGSLQISNEAIQLFKKYPWPGNIRELQGVTESMVILARGDRLEATDVPYEIRQAPGSAASGESNPSFAPNATLAEIEKQKILDSLDRFGGNRTKTAEALGIGRRTLIRKLHDYEKTEPSEENGES